MPDLGIIHPRLLASLPGFYPSYCTIEVPNTVNVKGEVAPAPWMPLEGHGRLRCRMAPAGGQEIKRSDMTYTVGSHTIALAGQYPAITARMRAIVDGVAYDILAVEHDGQGTMTRLQVQVVR